MALNIIKNNEKQSIENIKTYSLDNVSEKKIAGRLTARLTARLTNKKYQCS